MEILIAIILCLLGPSQVSPAAESENRAWSVCEVLSDRIQFNGRIIAVRGVLHSTFESAWLSGEGCDDQLRTGDHVWPSAINLSISETLAPWTEWPSVRDKAAMQRVDRIIRRQKPSSADRVWVTCVGRLETYTRLSERVYKNPDGKVQVRGLGHEAAFAVQLLAISSRDPKVEKHK
jgi:hypothetical protein